LSLKKRKKKKEKRKKKKEKKKVNGKDSCEANNKSRSTDQVGEQAAFKLSSRK